MKSIDGYVPVDKGLALEQGVDFDYQLDFGDIHIRSRTLELRSNAQFALALKQHQEWVQRRAALGSSKENGEAERRLAAIIYDCGVIEWSTTIKADGGKPIAPTRENFIDLMTHPACERAMNVYFRDAMDETNFRAAPREDDAKN